ncbi:MAG: CoA-binding protein [Chitinivibrionales bacterium]|nr:CoA-binding protein [Chitinivibrionales bacterium]
MAQKQTVAVLGASNKPDRYSNKALRMLVEYGHEVIPVHPAIHAIEGIPTVSDLSAIGQSVDTLTLYVGPARSEPIVDSMIALKPSRVIMNPGTESDSVEQKLTEAGIPVIKACTMVLLRTEQFSN